MGTRGIELPGLKNRSDRRLHISQGCRPARVRRKPPNTAASPINASTWRPRARKFASNSSLTWELGPTWTTTVGQGCRTDLEHGVVGGLAIVAEPEWRSAGRSSGDRSNAPQLGVRWNRRHGRRFTTRTRSRRDGLAGVGGDRVLQPDQTLEPLLLRAYRTASTANASWSCDASARASRHRWRRKARWRWQRQPANHNPSRSANARPIDLLQFEYIPDAAHRMKQLGLERPVDLLSQAVDQDVDRVGARIEAVVRDVRHDHRLRKDLARMTHEVLEQRELARSEARWAHRHARRAWSDDRDAGRRRPARSAPAQPVRVASMPAPGRAVLETRKAGQIVVATHLQALEPDRPPSGAH